MGISGELKPVQYDLKRDLLKAALTIPELANKYGVSRQSIYDFIKRKGIKRPKNEHTKRCLICQELIRIARKPQSDFLTARTIKERLKIGTTKFLYHIHILRSKRLVSQRFGMLRSKKLERAYQIYFTKRLPADTIGRLVEHKSFGSALRRHKDSGWDVPPPLFTYDSKERSKRRREDHAKRRKQAKRIGKETRDSK